MARPTWTPDTATDEQRQQWHAALQAVHNARTATEAQWQAFAAARDVGVPLDTLARAAGIPRATLYRHLTRNRPDRSRHDDTAT